MSLGDLSGSPAVPVVVGIRGLDRDDGFIQRAEREQPLAGRQRITESRVLGNDGTA